MKKYYLPLLMLASLTTFAQHDHHTPETTDTKKHDQDNSQPVHSSHDSTVMAPMTHAFSLNLPMTRNASGTGWLPDASPMYGYMLHTKKWMYMFHGNVFIRYNNQDFSSKGVRGDSKIDAPNWFMSMGQRRVGTKGLLRFSTMFSLDPIFGGDGYPLLFQTGESYEGEPLIDRQHPHDLFSELSIGYTQSFTKDFDAFVYIGYPGEPALGPVAFMHRPSSLNNPDATLGHHWSDATHITFGVATLGFRYKIFKVDASRFTGREPDEHRYNFDKPRFDSYAYRLTINPVQTLSMQVSRGLVKSPEGENTADVQRTTASATHILPMTRNNHSLSSTFVWGYNDSGPHHKENSFTLETNLQLDRFAIYGKYENIDKSAEELVLDQFEEHELFNISAITLGANYTFLRTLKTNVTMGAQASLYMADSTLDPIYGKNPMAAQVYVRVSPALMNIKKNK